LETPLTAREVREALEERIANGVYAPAARLPPVRSIAAEFGSSPSTISRALQELTRDGWLEVQERRFVRVRAEPPPQTARSSELERAMRAIANKWKLRGGSRESLLAAFGELVGEAFESEARFVFTECSSSDLQTMGDQIAREAPNIAMQRVLIDDLDPEALAQARAVVLVPYYHYAEVREKIGEDAPIVPLHSLPSTQTLDDLLAMPPGSKALVVGHNRRSVARLSGLVRDYSEARVVSAAKSDAARIAREAPQADVVVAVPDAAEALSKVKGVKRLVLVTFELEPTLRAKLSAAETLGRPGAAASVRPDALAGRAARGGTPGRDVPKGAAQRARDHVRLGGAKR
jgi:DNA-binding transcriptional regulator YhcF (GntR family)